MKTIDGKRIEELRIGQEVCMKETGDDLYEIKALTSSKGYWVKVFGFNDWLEINKISTVKPRKKVKKMLYCFKRVTDGKLVWELEDEVLHIDWERVPENDFEAEIFE